MKIRNMEMTLPQFKDAVLFKMGEKGFIRRESEGNGGKRVYSHVTYYLAKNAGDPALSKCVRQTFHTLSDVDHWNLISVKRPVTDQTIETINRSDAVIIGGGGLFLPDTNPLSEGISGWLWPVSNEQLDRIEVPVCIYAVGYNFFPGQRPDGLFIDSLQHLVKKSSFFGLRSYGSANAVKALIPEECREKVVFQPCTTNLIRKIFPDLPPKKTGKNVAVNIAFDREDRRFGNDRETILDQTAEAVKKIADKGYRIFVVSHRTGDEKILPYLEKKGVSYKFLDFSRKFPEKLINFYNNMDMVIGMRTHAQMIPFGVNCNIISLGTHQKMRWFLEDLDLSDWYVDMTEDSSNLASRIIDTFERVHEKEHDDTKARLLDAQEELWKITCSNMELIKNL